MAGTGSDRQAALDRRATRASAECGSPSSAWSPIRSAATSRPRRQPAIYLPHQQFTLPYHVGDRPHRRVRERRSRPPSVTAVRRSIRSSPSAKCETARARARARHRTAALPCVPRSACSRPPLSFSRPSVFTGSSATPWRSVRPRSACASRSARRRTQVGRLVVGQGLALAAAGVAHWRRAARLPPRASSKACCSRSAPPIRWSMRRSRRCSCHRAGRVLRTRPPRDANRPDHGAPIGMTQSGILTRAAQRAASSNP